MLIAFNIKGFHRIDVLKISATSCTSEIIIILFSMKTMFSVHSVFSENKGFTVFQNFLLSSQGEMNDFAKEIGKLKNCPKITF